MFCYELLPSKGLSKLSIIASFWLYRDHHQEVCLCVSFCIFSVVIRTNWSNVAHIRTVTYGPTLSGTHEK